MVNHTVNHKTTELINSLKNKDKIRILFVCLGNICRSPAAEEIMRSLVKQRGLEKQFELDSAGLYGGHAGEKSDPRMRDHAGRRGYKLTHRARQVREYDFDDFDIIIAMDDSNYDNLRRLAPSVEAKSKIVKMTDFARSFKRYDYVPDPYYEGADGFELVLDMLEDCCEGLLDSLTANRKQETDNRKQRTVDRKQETDNRKKI